MKRKDEKSMNVQQKLADIQMLITYIKEHLDMEPSKTESKRLDEIGKTTLEISGVLRSLEEKTGIGADNLFGEYKSIVNEAADMVSKQLKDIKTTLDTNTGLTNNLYQKIDDIYVKYTGILEESTTKLELQRENYAREIHNLISSVDTLTDMTKILDEKTMTEEQLKSLISGLEQQIYDVVGQDKALNTTYMENADRLESMINEVEQSYRNLNETLASVDGSFKTAVSRLDVLLMQMNLITAEKGE